MQNLLLNETSTWLNCNHLRLGAARPIHLQNERLLRRTGCKCHHQSFSKRQRHDISKAGTRSLHPQDTASAASAATLPPRASLALPAHRQGRTQSPVTRSVAMTGSYSSLAGRGLAKVVHAQHVPGAESTVSAFYYIPSLRPQSSVVRNASHEIPLWQGVTWEQRNSASTMKHILEVRHTITRFPFVGS